MPSNPKNKASKRVIERAKGAMKGNNSVLRGAVAKKGGGGSPRRVAAAAQEGWQQRPKKGGRSGPIRATIMAQ